MSKQLAQDLRDALAIMEREGWRQGPWKNDPVDRGPCCAMLAIDRLPIEPYSPRRGNAIEALELAAREIAPADFRPRTFTTYRLIDWNDTRGRTVDQVRAAFKLAIERAEATQ